MKALTEWLDGEFDFTEAEAAGESTRKIFASFIGAEADEIALVPFVSTSAGMIASQIPEAGPGENILVADCEFSSNYFPWLMLRKKGYEIRTVLTRNGTLSLRSFEEKADSRTRLIAVSAVQSSSGFRINPEEFSELAHRSGALLFVDACQATGAVPMDVRKDRIDILAVASHKYLLGARGMGYLFIRRELQEEFRPVIPGWKAAQNPFNSFYGPLMNLSPTASRFDSSLAWFPALAERASFELIERIGMEYILQRNGYLSDYLAERLLRSKLAFEAFQQDNRSTIFSIPVRNADKVMHRFKVKKIVTSLRAGSLRLSLNFYNTEEELKTVVGLLEESETGK